MSKFLSKLMQDRDRQVAAFLVSGHSTSEIMEATGLCRRSVELSRARLLRRYGAKTHTQLGYLIARKCISEIMP